MGFLDNSGDIILDAVLTDTGRARLAKGDGSFNIKKFALGDDEINYETYDLNHTSGSAYRDLAILQTPVLEAFTNNASSMKSRLVTYTNTNLLYLPMLKLNDLMDNSKRHTSLATHLVAINLDTRDKYATVQGVLDGYAPQGSLSLVRVDQGIDNTAVDPSEGPLVGEDLETQYIVEIDNRLGSIADPISTAGAVATPSFIDDDSIASYFFTRGTTANFVKDNTVTEIAALTEVVRGPRGTRLELKIKTSLTLRQSDFLFDQMGSTSTLVDAAGVTRNIKYIDTTIKVSGATTGYKIDIPVRFFRYC